MKAKTRKARETRAAYKVPRRKTRVARPRAVRSRMPKVVVVPWEKRVAATWEQLMEWDAWLNEHEAEFEEKYPGQFLAIWDKRIIAVASSRARVYARADQVRPEVIPLVTYVPREQDVYMIPSNFPVEWVAKADAKQPK